MSSKLKHPPGLIIEKPKKNINPHPNIIRQPYGPMEHRNFKVFKYNLYPREFDEFDYEINVNIIQLKPFFLSPIITLC